jgi:integrase
MPGTIRKLEPSKRDGAQRWELRVYVGRDPDKTVRDAAGKVLRQGPPVHASRVFRGGKREANKALDEFVAEVRESEAKSVVGRTATLGKLLDRWLELLENPAQGMARSTLETYRIHVDKHIRPALGGIRLDQLRVEDIDAYIGSLSTEKKLAVRTIKLDHAVLKAALNQGVEWKWLTENPAKAARVPGAKRSKLPKAPTMTTEQFETLCQAALEDDPDMAVFIWLAGITGCRRGEVCGLRWEDFDAKRATLRVERQWVPGKGGQALSDYTKTGDGRDVFIGAGGVAILETYRRAKEAEIGRGPDGWLVSYNGGESPMRAKGVTEYVSRLLKKLGITAKLHTLRHWKSTELQILGVDLPTAAAQMGHSISVMAETYLHSSDDRGSAAGELIAVAAGKALDPSALARALAE